MSLFITRMKHRSRDITIFLDLSLNLLQEYIHQIKDVSPSVSLSCENGTEKLKGAVVCI